MKKWKLLQSDPIFESKFISLFKNKYELPNGDKVDDYYHISRPNYVLILAFNDEKKIVLEKQYRRGVDEFLLELPAGWINEGESVEETAIRELCDEAGFIGKCQAVYEIYPEPGFMSMKAYVTIVHIDENQKSLRKPDPDENIEIYLESMKNIESMILDHKVKDMGFLAALSIYRLHSGL